MSKSSGSVSTGGIGFFGLMTLLFVYMKLTHQIDWAWGWVLAPSWMPAAAIVAVLLLVCGGALLVAGVGALWQKATRARPLRRGGH